jgi:predicted outer membrane protein
MYETYQIAAAQIAATQGRSQAVKTYAAAAATAHRAALQALIEIARTSRLPANDAMLSDNYRAYLDRLSSPSDVAFDARYSAQQAIVTMTMAGRYDAFTSTALHSELQQWATSQSQSIHDQISAARQLAAESAHP